MVAATNDDFEIHSVPVQRNLVVDAGQLARFAKAFADLLESASVLLEEEAPT